jgi:AraC family transcriptional regulator of adaptative response/methylated-DNA-[protein]-cysteine methyltransferase
MAQAQTHAPTPDSFDAVATGTARLDQQASDYARMGAALQWLAEHWRDRPRLDQAAEVIGLSEFHFQRLFTRWAGVSPKTFMAAIAHGQARQSLEAGASVLDAALDVGLSGPSRLHDMFIAHEAATPGEVRRRGEGLILTYGYAPCPFGISLFVSTPRGLCGLAFCDSGDEATALSDMLARWPAADWQRDDTEARILSAAVFLGDGPAPPLALIGPPFHIQVWKALLKIPAGATATYADVAAWTGRPAAFRATGAAIGANPISYLIPCHRAIAKDGRLTGYHWGLARKAAMLGHEAVMTASA